MPSTDPTITTTTMNPTQSPNTIIIVEPVHPGTEPSISTTIGIISTAMKETEEEEINPTHPTQSPATVVTVEPIHPGPVHPGTEPPILTTIGVLSTSMNTNATQTETATETEPEPETTIMAEDTSCNDECGDRTYNGIYAEISLQLQQNIYYNQMKFLVFFNKYYLNFSYNLVLVMATILYSLYAMLTLLI